MSTFREFSVGASTPISILEEGELFRALFMTVESANIRFRYDGGSPSSGSGHPLTSGGNISFSNSVGIRHLKVIAQSGTATVRVTLE